MVSIRDLHFAYRRKPVFTGLNLDLRPGHIYGLLGRNGTGKSTLLRNIAGMLFPKMGRIGVLGFEPARRQPAFLQKIFMVPEDFHLPPIPLEQWMRFNAPFYPLFSKDAFMKYAVDFDGDGKADIWRNVPDVLASIANYLQQTGWQKALPWGFEVRVPVDFDYRFSRGTFSDWAQRGFARADGSPLPKNDTAPAILFFPSGASGPAFLVTDNFVVLKRFNNSDAYALAAGTLSDLLRGLPAIRAHWPADDFQPSRDERIALQHRLADLGYKIAEFEGHFDFDLRDAVRVEQRRFGMIPDGYPSRAFLSRIGVRTP